MKWIKSEKYKGVYGRVNNGKNRIWCYQFTYKGTNYYGTYQTEKESALNYDLKRIDLGLNPINILKLKL